MRKIMIVLLIFQLCFTMIGFSTIPTSAQNTSASQNLALLSNNSKNFEKIGPQIVNTSAITSAAGFDKNGNALMYVILQGEPAKIVVVDIISNKVVDEKALGNSTTAWAIAAAKDGMVWIGGTPTEQLYSYNPNTKALKNHGKASDKTSTSIHDLDIMNDGTVYGSSSVGGNVFKYQNGKGFKNLGRVVAGKNLARSLASSDDQKTLFIGLGAKADLVAWNLSTNKKQSILPSNYRNETSVYDLDEEKGILFAKLEPSKKILLFDSKSFQFLGELPASSRGVSPISPDGKKVFYTHNYHLYQYDVINKQNKMFNFTLKGTEAVSLDIIEKDGPILVGLLGNTGTYMKFNLNTEQIIIDKLPLPPQSVPIYNIESGSDGKIYSSGFVSGHMAIYDPKSKTSKTLRNLGQAEGITSLNGKMYFGIYPGATVYEYDPNDGTNTTRLFTIGNGQDRTVAMIGVNQLNKLFIGTHPKNGEIGGSLTIYDAKSKKVTVRRNIIKDQSITALTYQNGYLYGGTSIFSGKNLEGKANAIFFRMKANETNGKIETLSIPIQRPRLIHALLTGPDQRIWGLSDGNLFAYDPKSKKTTVIKVVATTSGRIKNGSLTIGKNGYVYGMAEHHLFRVHPKTMKLEMLLKSDVDDITSDSEGNIYYSNKADLWVYKP